MYMYMCDTQGMLKFSSIVITAKQQEDCFFTSDSLHMVSGWVGLDSLQVGGWGWTVSRWVGGAGQAPQGGWVGLDSLHKVGGWG